MGQYIFMFRSISFCVLALAMVGTARADGFSITDSINQAVRTNPGVYEAAANRRATESELRQTQSTLLPQVRVEAKWGPERFYQDITPAPTGNDAWRNGREGSVVVRQILFDGFASIHDIWRQSARVNAAAFRTRERSELIALDAAEAYIDVVRYMRLVALAEQNLANHKSIFGNVQSRFSGGRAGEGDLEQSRERVESASAAVYEFRRSLEDARAKYRKVVGLEPYNLRFPGPLRGLPNNKDEALAVTIRHNPTIQAAQADSDTAKHAFRVTDGAFMPSVHLEGRVSRGVNANNYLGQRDEASGKVVASWDVFRGGQDVWRRNEMAERYTETVMRHARLQRDALESVDKAWAARTITAGRIAALSRQLASDRKTISAFRKEYELGQRSLIDLLNAENQYFNAAVSLVSARGVVVFADYQLLATMGALLEYLRTAPPVEAITMEPPLGAFPMGLPPLRLTLPDVGSQPLNVAEEPVVITTYAAEPKQPQGAVAAISERWPTWSVAPSFTGVHEWLAQSRGVSLFSSGASTSGPGKAFAATSQAGEPHWLVSVRSQR